MILLPYSDSSNTEGAHHTDHILATNGALIHLLATHHTRDHVATFQENTVNRRVHAYLTEDLILNHYTPRYIRRRAT